MKNDTGMWLAPQYTTHPELNLYKILGMIPPYLCSTVDDINLM